MREIIIPAVPEHTVLEDVTSITIESTMKNITLILARYQAGENIGHRSVSLGTAGYQLLMETESPEWAPGKPMGSFRREDIFAVLDILKL
jgi:hypothetical protein